MQPVVVSRHAHGARNPYWPATQRGVAAGRSAQRACERSYDWRRGAAGSPEPKKLPRTILHLVVDIVGDAAAGGDHVAVDGDGFGRGEERDNVGDVAGVDPATDQVVDH